MMKEYSALLQLSGLFNNIDAAELETMLSCLGVEIKDAKKGEALLLAGDAPTHIGMALSGQIHIYREDYNGNRALIAAITPGGLFAEALCCAGVAESPVTVVADIDSRVMLMRFSRILRTCPHACSHHAKLIENMLGIIAKKNLMLQGRLEIASSKSVRAKALRFLESFVPKQGKDIIIPFNRDAMAEFLCVERSALSHELMRMRRDGLIEYKKNRFLLKQ